MNLKEKAREQVNFMGKTPGGCLLVLHNLLDNGCDIFQFMQLFNKEAVEVFYYEYAAEIDEICAEDADLLLGDVSIQESTIHALEKTLMLIEDEIKNDTNR